MTDNLVGLLRLYGKRFTANAIDSSLMLEAADRIEKYEKQEAERKKEQSEEEDK